MKRDMDLVRALLMRVELEHFAHAPRKIEINGYTEERIGYHAFLLNEAGLMKAVVVTTFDNPSPEARIIRLIWAGHEFLDSAREPARWGKAKDLVNKVGGASIQLWMAVLTAYTRDALGI